MRSDRRNVIAYGRSAQLTRGRNNAPHIWRRQTSSNGGFSQIDSRAPIHAPLKRAAPLPDEIRPFSPLSLFPLPSSLFFSCLPCSPVRRFSLFVIMSVSVALLSRAPFAGTAFYLRICLSVHAFTDLHLGNTRFTPLYLFLLPLNLLFFNSRCSFIFIA